MRLYLAVAVAVATPRLNARTLATAESVDRRRPSPKTREVRASIDFLIHEELRRPSSCRIFLLIFFRIRLAIVVVKEEVGALLGLCLRVGGLDWSLLCVWSRVAWGFGFSKERQETMRRLFKAVRILAADGLIRRFLLASVWKEILGL
ncbi:hypothetical protein EUGRSUZ_K01736 [Eucalyptus grandis]|uniref:Uncharacterized protein n=2 Tax=Eucalyptus grandis TaxID=71139 RepID=A0A059A1M0_EUCGR|nr:hypothetical protein EUGRSUZ_K01736 [Eucalyptus grandis]